MAQYKVIKPINAGSGFLMDANGNSVSMQSLVPKVGDIISGTIETKFIFNQNVTGISYPISAGATGAAGNSLIMIPQDALELVGSNNGNKPNPVTSFFTPKNIIIGILAIGVIIGVLKLAKVI